jgi:hypothetical protein
MVIIQLCRVVLILTQSRALKTHFLRYFFYINLIYNFYRKKIKQLYLPAVCCGFIPIPSLVIMAEVAAGTLN